MATMVETAATRGAPRRATSSTTLDPGPSACAGSSVAPPDPPPLARWGRRVAANVLDGLFSGWPVLLGLGYLITTLHMQEIPYEGWTGFEVRLPSVQGVVVLVLGYAANSGLSLWNRMYLQGSTGQSVGKKAMGIRLVDEVGLHPIGPSNAYLRDLAHALDLISSVGYLRPLWDAKRQTFADRIVKAVVVDA